MLKSTSDMLAADSFYLATTSDQVDTVELGVLDESAFVVAGSVT